LELDKRVDGRTGRPDCGSPAPFGRMEQVDWLSRVGQRFVIERRVAEPSGSGCCRQVEASIATHEWGEFYVRLPVGLEAFNLRIGRGLVLCRSPSDEHDLAEGIELGVGEAEQQRALVPACPMPSQRLIGQDALWDDQDVDAAINKLG